MKSKGYQLCDNSGYDLSNDNLFLKRYECKFYWTW